MAVTQEPALSWRVHLARRQPLRAGACVAAALLAGVAAGLIWQSGSIGLLAGLLVLSSVADFLCPLRYRIDAAGVSRTHLLGLQRIEWSQVRRCYADDQGFKVSPLDRPSRLEAYRGIYLWPDDNAEQVAAALRHYLHREAA